MFYPFNIATHNESCQDNKCPLKVYSVAQINVKISLYKPA